MKVIFALPVGAVIAFALLVTTPANAQLQTQGMTVGSPGPSGDTKPTRAECTKKAGAQKLRGSKRTSFIRKCMAGEATE